MSLSGHVNVDALVHDSASGAFKVLDVESSLASIGKAVLVTGQASEAATLIDPSDTGYRDATGAVVTMSSVTTLVAKSTGALTIEAGAVTVQAAAGQACVSALTAYDGIVSVTGTGDFSLLLIGPA